MGVRVWVVICLGLLVSAVSAAQRLDLNAIGEAKTTDTGDLVLRGAFHGEVEGTIRATFRIGEASQVTGDWSVTLFTKHADGSRSEAGTLLGRVDAATARGGEDRIVELRDVKLVVTEGLGEYAGLSEGSGTLDIHLGFPGEPFQGSLSLIF